MKATRRQFLRALPAAGLAAAAAQLLPQRAALAEVGSSAQGEFFLFIIALGGWDVTLWADPRNEARGLIHPASTENTDTGAVRLWKDAPLAEGTRTFELIRPPGSHLVFGPGIGNLAALSDRLTIVNGLEMNTVAHPDGQVFSVTGRHPQGGRVAAASIDTMLANELGRDQLLPTVSIRFPSAYVGDDLDRRVVPLMVDDVGSISRTMARTEAYDTDGERDRVTAMLSEEANDLARRSALPDVASGFGLQYGALRRMLGGNLEDVFSAGGLKRGHPEFDYKARFSGGAAVNAAFAAEAMKRNVVRCVSFAVSGFDTHGSNYRGQAQLQQETFDLVAALVRSMDDTPHPTLHGERLSEHTHIMVVSDFCRTPQINLGMGRDHYPNNSTLLISPRFRGGLALGETDAEQLLPRPTRRFAGGVRAPAPPDILATWLSAFGVNPRKYMRDGEVLPELLRA